MYSLKPMCNPCPIPIDYSECMYAMKNMTRNNSDSATDQLEALEKRQDDIVERMGSLTITMDDIIMRRGISGSNCGSAVLKGNSSEHLSLAVHADPNYPPISLFVLVDLLRSQGRRVFLTNHVHSSLLSVDHQKIARFMQTSTTNQAVIPRHQCNLLIAIIWKSLPPPFDCRVIISSFRHHSFLGEVMLTRSLWSLVSNQDLTPIEAAELDFIDIGLLLASSKEDQLSALKILAVTPSCKSKKIGPVAALLSSALHNMGINMSNKMVPGPVQEWLKSGFRLSPTLEQVMTKF